VSDYRVVAAISWYPTRFEQAKAVLENVRTGHPHADVYPAVSALLLAVGLEDAIRSKIAERVANGKVVGQSSHAYESIQSASLRQRMTGLAQVVGRGFFGAPANRTQARALHGLVSLRNELLHIEEAVHELDEHHEKVAIDDDVMTVRLELPTDPWSSVSVANVTTFVEAVDRYDQEVLRPLSDMAMYWAPAV
jgi:hypothetical protein